MKNHVWRPLFVVIVLIILVLLVRQWYLPADFGVQEQGYTFGYHRLGNEQEWKSLPSLYVNNDKSNSYCGDCHSEHVESVSSSPHLTIPCENCHGAARQHPESPEKLPIDRSRELCLRCHSKLFMPSSDRNDIPGILPQEHNQGIECSACHNPHKPNLEEI